MTQYERGCIQDALLQHVQKYDIILMPVVIREGKATYINLGKPHGAREGIKGHSVIALNLNAFH